MDLPADDRLSHVLNASERLARAGSVEEVVAVLRDTARDTVGAQGIAVIIEHDSRCFYVAEDAVSPCGKARIFRRMIAFQVGRCVTARRW